jgi:hypothetical protein
MALSALQNSSAYSAAEAADKEGDKMGGTAELGDI